MINYCNQLSEGDAGSAEVSRGQKEINSLQQMLDTEYISRIVPGKLSHQGLRTEYDDEMAGYPKEMDGLREKPNTERAHAQSFESSHHEPITEDERRNGPSNNKRQIGLREKLDNSKSSRTGAWRALSS